MSDIHPNIEQWLSSLAEKVRVKNESYGNSFISAAQAFRKKGEPLPASVLRQYCVRVLDKLNRIHALSESEKADFFGEGIPDALDDVVGYTMLAKSYLLTITAMKDTIIGGIVDSLVDVKDKSGQIWRNVNTVTNVEGDNIFTQEECFTLQPGRFVAFGNEALISMLTKAPYLITSHDPTERCFQIESDAKPLIGTDIWICLGTDGDKKE